MKMELELALALMGGLVIGSVYCMALWWQVRRVGGSDRSGVWLLLGSVLRMGLVMLAFHLLTGWQPLQLLLALGGFVLARVTMVRVLGGTRETAA